ncbi:hypothetical protein GW626_17200 [Peribacillus muralis]
MVGLSRQTVELLRQTVDFRVTGRVFAANGRFFVEKRLNREEVGITARITPL